MASNPAKLGLRILELEAMAIDSAFKRQEAELLQQISEAYTQAYQETLQKAFDEAYAKADAELKRQQRG